MSFDPDTLQRIADEFGLVLPVVQRIASQVDARGDVGNPFALLRRWCQNEATSTPRPPAGLSAAQDWKRPPANPEVLWGDRADDATAKRYGEIFLAITADPALGQAQLTLAKAGWSIEAISHVLERDDWREILLAAAAQEAKS